MSVCKEDLEFKEERSLHNQQQPIKKHIPLKLKSGNAQPIVKLNHLQSAVKQQPQQQQQQLTSLTNQQTQSFNLDSTNNIKTEPEFPQKRPYTEMNSGFSVFSLSFFKLNTKMLYFCVMDKHKFFPY